MFASEKPCPDLNTGRRGWSERRGTTLLFSASVAEARLAPALPCSPTMSGLVQDLRHGLRLLWKSPGFAVATLAVLALGIGANAAIFSVVNAVLLRPMPYPEPERVVRVWHTPPARAFPGLKRFAVSPANYFDWERQNHVFEKMAIHH